MNLRSRRQIRYTVISSAFAILLAACGGGSPSSSSNASGNASPLGSGSGTATATYTVSWEAVPPPAAVTGYRIYYSKLPFNVGGAVGSVDIPGAVTTVSFAAGSYGFNIGDTLYVAVSSTGSGGVSSPPSDQISIAVQ